jgi:hypothetical protein
MPERIKREFTNPDVDPGGPKTYGYTYTDPDPKHCSRRCTVAIVICLTKSGVVD